MYLAETLAFVAVVRAGSFTEAGRRLGVPKSTLSRQVARLEKHLGARLLQRTTRKLSLTETGEAYFARCEPAIEDIEEAERVALDVSGRPAGLLRVSAPFDYARDRLTRLLPAFHERYPDIQLGLIMSQRRVDMLAEGIDVALRGGELADSGFVSRRIAPADLILCASPGYLERRGRPRAIADLQAHDAVMMSPDGKPTPWAFPGPDGPEELPLSPWLVANEWGVLRAMLRAGLGVGVMLEPDVRGDLEAGALERVLPGYTLPAGGLHAVYPSRHHLTPKVRVFVDFLVEQSRDGLEPTAPVVG